VRIGDGGQLGRQKKSFSLDGFTSHGAGRNLSLCLELQAETGIARLIRHPEELSSRQVVWARGYGVRGRRNQSLSFAALPDLVDDE
jgi:hypothetical protein